MRNSQRHIAGLALGLSLALLGAAPALRAQVQPPAHQHPRPEAQPKADARNPVDARPQPQPRCPMMMSDTSMPPDTAGGSARMGGMRMGMHMRGMGQGMAADSGMGMGMGKGMGMHGRMGAGMSGDSSKGMGMHGRMGAGMSGDSAMGPGMRCPVAGSCPMMGRGRAGAGMAGKGMAAGAMEHGAGMAMEEASSSAPKPKAVRAPAQGGCPAVTGELVERGRAIFVGRGNCFVCHGRDARGTALAPALVPHRWIHVDGSYAAITRLVATGVSQPRVHPAPMPASGGAALSDAERCAVGAYVFSISRQ